LFGYCDALGTPRTLGPFKDVAAALGHELAAALNGGERDAVMTALHEALLGRGPTVLVVEDVHWADEATLDTLRFLARRIEQLPVLRLGLAPLSPTGVSELVAGGRLDARVVYSMTNGNPYLVTEMIASTAGTG